MPPRSLGILECGDNLQTERTPPSTTIKSGIASYALRAGGLVTIKTCTRPTGESCRSQLQPFERPHGNNTYRLETRHCYARGMSRVKQLTLILVISLPSIPRHGDRKVPDGFRTTTSRQALSRTFLRPHTCLATAARRPSPRCAGACGARGSCFLRLRPRMNISSRTCIRSIHER